MGNDAPFSNQYALEVISSTSSKRSRDHDDNEAAREAKRVCRCTRNPLLDTLYCLRRDPLGGFGCFGAHVLPENLMPLYGRCIPECYFSFEDFLEQSRLEEEELRERTYVIELPDEDMALFHNKATWIGALASLRRQLSVAAKDFIAYIGPLDVIKPLSDEDE
ncbi:hypothetical protein ACO1O0_003556 [Amphichorda felina]